MCRYELPNGIHIEVALAVAQCGRSDGCSSFKLRQSVFNLRSAVVVSLGALVPYACVLYRQMALDVVEIDTSASAFETL